MKKCFKCLEVKPLSEFYKHKMMADGRLNKCKQCAKDDAASRYYQKIKEPEWMLAERTRQREKERSRREQGKVKKYKRGKVPQNPANVALGNAVRLGKVDQLPCVICGNTKSQGHHEDYSKPLDVVWLCVRHHNDRHIEIRESKLFGINPPKIEDFIERMKCQHLAKLQNED